MSDIHCRLCASDEGVFLDIFTAGKKTYSEKLETCLSLKVEKGDAFSTKLCHKCAFELNQCDKFVRKYKQARRTLAYSKASQQKNRCSLCAQTNKSGYIFQLGNDEQCVDESARKIYECFEQDPPKIHVTNLLICLQCRYNLDILSDLKVLSKKSVEKLKEISLHTATLSNLPKTLTFVVSRKTTSILREKMDVIDISDTEADSSTMKPIASRVQPKRMKNGKVINKRATRTNRLCGQCHNTIKNGVDMYRFHSTGLTVCKFCWSTMDPSKTSLIKKRAQGTATKKNTKLCSVFLTDVMGDASLKDNRGYKIEKDEEDNTTFVVMDDGSEEDDTTVKIKKEAEESGSRKLRTRSRKCISDIDDSSVKVKPVKKLKSDGESNEQTFNPGVRKSLRQKRIKIEEIHIDSDTSISRKRKASKVESQPEKKKKYAKKTSFSDDDAQVITSRITRTSLRSQKSYVSQSELSDSTSGSSSSESNAARPKRKTGAANITPMTQLFKKNVAEVVNLKSSSISVSSKESTPPSDIPSLEKSKLSSSSRKSPLQKSKVIKKKANLLTTNTIDKLKKDKEEYVCPFCNVAYKNKLIGMTHELSHLRQPEITLCRIRTASESEKTKKTVEDTKSTTSNVDTDGKMEEQSHDVSSTSDALREKANQESAESQTDVISLKQKENSNEDQRVDDADVAESKDLVSTEEKSAEVELGKMKKAASVQEEGLETSKKEMAQKEEKKKEISPPVDIVNNVNEKADEKSDEVSKTVDEECKEGESESGEVEKEKETSEDAFQLSVETKEVSPDPEQISQAQGNVNETRNEGKKGSDSLDTMPMVSVTENDKSMMSKDINELGPAEEEPSQAEESLTIEDPPSKEVPIESSEASEKDVEKDIEEKGQDSETAPAPINLNGSITKDSETKELTDDEPKGKNETKDKDEDKNVEEEEDDEEIITSIYIADDESRELEDEKQEDQHKEGNNKEASEDIPEVNSEGNGKLELVDTSEKADCNTEKNTNKESVKLEEVLTKMFEEETPVTENLDANQTSKVIEPSEESIPETLENISKEIGKESQEHKKDESKNFSVCSSDLNIGKMESSEKKKVEEEYITQNT